MPLYHVSWPNGCQKFYYLLFYWIYTVSFLFLYVNFLHIILELYINIHLCVIFFSFKFSRIFCFWKSLSRRSRMNCISYSNNVLQAIRTSAKPEHALFNLLHDCRRKIILLGIWKQPIDHPYRRSRAGTKLFHKINSIISNHISQSKPKSSICDKKLIFIGYNGSSKTHNLNLSHINAWSIVNKIDLKWSSMTVI